jgi:hypothetical protein
LEKRLDNQLLEEAAPVLQGVKSCVDITMKINNEDRAFASTLSYHISMYVSMPPIISVIVTWGILSCKNKGFYHVKKKVPKYR